MLQKLFTNHHLALVGIGAMSIMGYFYASQPINESTELNKIRRNIEYACKHSQAVVPLKIDMEVTRNEQGIDFILKIVNTLQKKPKIVEDGRQQPKDPFKKPFERGIMVQNLPPRHYLVLNKYPIFENHVLVITKEFQYQENPNTDEDLYQTYKIIRSLEGFAFFNSCQEAGASQPHKHIQVLCNKAFNESNILTTITHVIQNDENFESSLDKSSLAYRLKAFKRIRHSIRPIIDPNNQQHIYSQYLALLRDLNGKQIVSNESITSMKYNLIMTPKFMMIVERKKEKYRDQISINAVGFTGSILVKSEEQLKFIGDVRIIEILEEVSEMQTDDIIGISWI